MTGEDSEQPNVMFADQIPKEKRVRSRPVVPAESACCAQARDMSRTMATVHHFAHGRVGFTEGQVADAADCSLSNAAKACEKARGVKWVKVPKQDGAVKAGRGRMWVGNL